MKTCHTQQVTWCFWSLLFVVVVVIGYTFIFIALFFTCTVLMIIFNELELEHTHMIEQWPRHQNDVMLSTVFIFEHKRGQWLTLKATTTEQWCGLNTQRLNLTNYNYEIGDLPLCTAWWCLQLPCTVPQRSNIWFLS